MAACEFCSIAAGECDVHVLFDREGVLALLDENPAREGHAVVMPKPHREELLGVSESATPGVFEAVDDLAGDLRAVLGTEGFSVFYTSASLVGSVDHAHVHLVPRADDDGVSLSLDRTALDHADAADLAAAVRDRE